MVGLRREVSRSGRPMKHIVNDALRAGLARHADRRPGGFIVRAQDLGLRRGLDLDDIEGLLDRFEGPARR